MGWSNDRAPMARGRLSATGGRTFAAFVIGLTSTAQVSAVELVPTIEPHGLIFPALEYAAADLQLAAVDGVYGQSHGRLGAQVSGLPGHGAAELWIDIDALGVSGSERVELSGSEQTIEIYPRLNFDSMLADPADEPVEVVVRFTLRLPDRPPLLVKRRAIVQPANEVLYYVDRPGALDDDYGWLFAAYVDSEHPALSDLLAEALQHGAVDDFDGYASGDPDRVLEQALSIWYALERRGLSYRPLPQRERLHPKVYSQPVRTISQTLASREANCVDGSLLIASALSRIGIEPVLVLLPGHMLVGFALDPGRSRYAYLETTRLSEGRATREPTLNAAIDRYDAALLDAQAQVSKAAAHLAHGQDPDYQLIDLATARELGVRALPPHLVSE